MKMDLRDTGFNSVDWMHPS